MVSILSFVVVLVHIPYDSHFASLHYTIVSNAFIEGYRNDGVKSVQYLVDGKKLTVGFLHLLQLPEEVPEHDTIMQFKLQALLLN